METDYYKQPSCINWSLTAGGKSVGDTESAKEIENEFTAELPPTPPSHSPPNVNLMPTVLRSKLEMEQHGWKYNASEKVIFTWATMTGEAVLDLCTVISPCLCGWTEMYYRIMCFIAFAMQMVSAWKVYSSSEDGFCFCSRALSKGWRVSVISVNCIANLNAVSSRGKKLSNVESLLCLFIHIYYNNFELWAEGLYC